MMASCTETNYSCTYKKSPTTTYNTSRIGGKYKPSKSKSKKSKQHKINGKQK